MFMVSVRVRRNHLTAFLVIALVVTLGVIGGRALFSGGDSVPAGAPAHTKPGKVTLKTEGQRLEFIRSFGWEVEPEPAEVMEIIIPKEFDAIYDEYNSMQKLQGFDLRKHAGKRAKRYTYVVINYPGQTEDVRINLLVRNNRLIGGDVCSLLKNGFIHGFDMPAVPTPQGML